MTQGDRTARYRALAVRGAAGRGGSRFRVLARGCEEEDLETPVVDGSSVPLSADDIG
jgi:hypothetical protein